MCSICDCKKRNPKSQQSDSNSFSRFWRMWLVRVVYLMCVCVCTWESFACIHLVSVWIVRMRKISMQKRSVNDSNRMRNLASVWKHTYTRVQAVDFTLNETLVHLSNCEWTHAINVNMCVRIFCAHFSYKFMHHMPLLVNNWPIWCAGFFPDSIFLNRKSERETGRYGNSVHNSIRIFMVWTNSCA